MVDIADKVIEIVKRRLLYESASVARDAALEKDLHADHLDMLELVIDVEDEFDMCVNGAEAARFRTVGDIIDYVERNVAPEKKEG